MHIIKKTLLIKIAKNIYPSYCVHVKFLKTLLVQFQDRDQHGVLRAGVERH